MKHVKGLVFTLALVLALVGAGTRGRAEGKLAQGEEGSLPPLVNLSPEEETQVKERMAKAFGISAQAAGKILKDYNQKQDLEPMIKENEENKAEASRKFKIALAWGVIAFLALIVSLVYLARSDDLEFACPLIGCFFFFFIALAIFVKEPVADNHPVDSIREDQEQREMAIQYLLEEEHPQVDGFGLSHLSRFVESYY